jgi:hypothetical protein
MIARMFFHLPYSIYLPSGQTFGTLALVRDDYTVVIHPPQQLLEMTVFDLKLAVPPKQSERISYNGQPVYEMNVLPIEIRKEYFDRTKQTEKGPDESNSTIVLGYELANEFLAMLRNATQNPDIRPIECEVFLQYLDDSYAVLPEEPDKIRITSRQGLVELRNPVIDVAHWNALKTTNFEDHLHRTLLIDAKAIFPELASIILAYSAIESATKFLIATLSESSLPPGVAEWITKSSSKESGLEKLYSGPVHALTGVSLKDEKDFWISFLELKELRHSIVHKGKAILKDKPASRSDLSRVIEGAKTIVRRIEELASIPPRVEVLSGPIEIAIPLLRWGAGTIYIKTNSTVEAVESPTKSDLPDGDDGSG